MEDGTVRTRTRQSILRRKGTLAICAVVAIVAFAGWLTSL